MTSHFATTFTLAVVLTQCMMQQTLEALDWGLSCHSRKLSTLSPTGAEVRTKCSFTFTSTLYLYTEVLRQRYVKFMKLHTDFLIE
jgi:hypothetical protein